MKGRGIKPPVEKIIIRGCLARNMVKGLKQTSSPITISFVVEETAPNTFAQNQVDLSLNVLDREVFVVTGINLDSSEPDALAGINTNIRGALSTTSRTTMGSLASNNVLAISRKAIRAGGFVDGGVGFTDSFGESPAAGMEYLAIIATNDFFVQVEGANNIAPGSMVGKLYGYRAVADAATFAALTQSELLSA